MQKVKNFKCPHCEATLNKGDSFNKVIPRIECLSFDKEDNGYVYDGYFGEDGDVKIEEPYYCQSCQFKFKEFEITESYTAFGTYTKEPEEGRELQMFIGFDTAEEGKIDVIFYATDGGTEIVSYMIEDQETQDELLDNIIYDLENETFYEGLDHRIIPVEDIPHFIECLKEIKATI